MDQPKADGGGVAALGGVEGDVERARLRQAFENIDIGDRGSRREVVAISGGEGLVIAVQQRHRPLLVLAGKQQVAEIVAPCPRQRRDAGFEVRLRAHRRLADIAPDDEVDAGQRHRFGKRRIVCRQPSLERVGEIGPDALPHGAVVAVAGHENEHRDVAVELVRPDQRAHARTLLERQDFQREGQQQIVIDLEQFVARIGLQHIDQRLAGVSAGIVAGAHQRAFDLPPQERDRQRRLACRRSR